MAMKCVVVVGGGMADEPIADLGGKTPLEAARTPNLDHLAGRGILGLTRTISPASLVAGDMSSLAVLGYDPIRYQSGCGAFEAAAQGIALDGRDVAFRMQLVTLQRREEDGAVVMADATGGRPGAEEARALVADLASALAGEDIEVHTGRGFRHLLVWRGGEPAVRTQPPYAIVDQPVAPALPQGPRAEHVRARMDRAAAVLSSHPQCDARRARGERAPNAIWLWGGGTRRSLPSLQERFGVAGAVVAGTDLPRGVGALAGLRVVDAPAGADLRGQALAGLGVLDEVDFLFLHVAAPDEASHLGDARQKVEAIEQLDESVLGVVLEGLRARGGEWRLLVLADHATPCARRLHTADPVPFVVYGTAHDARTVGSKRAYHERDAREQGIFVAEAHSLLERLLRA